MAEANPSKIVVAETGNRRTEISNEDLTQCLKDITSWIQQNAPAHFNNVMQPRAVAEGQAAKQVQST